MPKQKAAQKRKDLSSATITHGNEFSESKKRRERTGGVTNPKSIFEDKNSPQHDTEQSALSKQLKYCENILKEMLSRKHWAYAWPFYKPVDTVALELHDYHDIIKYPMDLSTVKVELVLALHLHTQWCFDAVAKIMFCWQKKLDGGEYEDAQAFAADIRLIFSNCYKYNPPHHDIVTKARKLQVCIKKWE